MSRDEYIIYLADKVASGEIDFSRVRKELERQGLSEAHTRAMVRLIDKEVLSLSEARAKRVRGNSYLVVGSLMTVAGLITTITFMGTPVVYFIGYGPFTTGLGLIVAGRRAQLRTPRPRSHGVARGFRKRSNG